MAAHAREEVVDQREGVGGVGARSGVPGGSGVLGRGGALRCVRRECGLFAPRSRVRRARRGRLLAGGSHHVFQAGVHDPQQCSQAAALAGGELGAVAVAAVDPRVEGVGVAADDGDRASVAAGERGRDRDAQVGEALGGPVLAGDGGGVGGVRVEVVLEEVAPSGGAQPVTAVQQPLVDGLAGERGAGGVPAEQSAQRGRVGHGGWYTGARHAPDARARFRAVSWALSQKVTKGQQVSQVVASGRFAGGCGRAAALRVRPRPAALASENSSRGLVGRDNVPLLRPPARL
ncbi:hypothetical protein SAMN04487983_104039 [Streptomyces sp. yr375]|nr:hypothetical protein SAMN04487983_104039 [Streptomyces sp. yr375]